MEGWVLLSRTRTHWRLLPFILFGLFIVNSLIFSREEYKSAHKYIGIPSSENVEVTLHVDPIAQGKEIRRQPSTGSENDVDDGDIENNREYETNLTMSTNDGNVVAKSDEKAHLVKVTDMVQDSDVIATLAKSSKIDQIRYVGGEPYNYSSDLKTILLWTTYEMKTNWWNTNTYGQDPFSRCKINTCFLSNNKSHVAQGDFVMFHYNEGPDFPKVRYPHQSYVHAMKERPIPRQTWLLEFENQINLTFNYRHDADMYFWPYTFPARPEPRKGRYTLRVPLKDKPYSVVWPVSHCATASKRERYVKELSKYIDVHIYGRCGNYSCPKRPWYTCFKMFESKYKFYLSFENSICKDYISEKAQVPMHYELLAIVMGGGDYENTLPPGSYLDVRNFTSPRHLADYLHQLAADDQRYAEYLQWKQQYTVGGRFDRLCVLCQAAHNDSFRRPVHENYYSWWHDVCDNDLVPRMQAQGGW